MNNRGLIKRTGSGSVYLEVLKLPRARPMSVIATGVSELRVSSIDGTFRVFFLVVTTHRVLIFHAFQKKTQDTPLMQIKLAKRRLRELIEDL
jgi:phage-related protein